MRNIILFMAIILCSFSVKSQNNYRVSYTANVTNPRLLVFEQDSKKLEDSLKKVILPLISQMNYDSLSIKSILSFDNQNRKISFWKFKNRLNNSVFTLKLIQVGKSFEIFNDNDIQTVYQAFGTTKIEVFRELLFANGEFRNSIFKELLNTTRGNLGLLNISKLADVIQTQFDKYKELFEK